MSDQTIHSASEAPKGNPIRAGGRGGLYYQDTGGDRNVPPRGKPLVKPDHIASGPGYDIGFFKKSGGFRVRYKGPNAEPVLKKIKSYLDKGISIEESISKIRSE